MADTTIKHSPTGLQRVGFRIPVYIYRLGLGWLFGERLVLINHLGRKTGSPRQTVVEVIEHDQQMNSITVVAGYGAKTQWYQNLQAHPEVTIQMGRRKMPVAAAFVSAEDGEEIMSRYVKRHHKLTRELFLMMGYPWDGTEQGARQIAYDILRFVRFSPKSV